MVVDELVVTLGLDPKNFNEGQRKALESFKGTVESFQKQGHAAEDSAKSLTDFLSSARTQALSLFAVFTGAKGLVDFTENTIRSTAAVGRLSHSTGVSIGEITKLQGLVRVFGGDAGQASSEIITLSDAMSGLKLGQVSPLITLLRALQNNGGVPIDNEHGPAAMLASIAENLKNIHDRFGADVAGNLGRQLGLDPALFEAMIGGAARFNEQLAQIKGLTEADAKAALELQQRWDGLVNTVDTGAKKGLFEVIDRLKPLGRELDKPFWESKPFDAMFGWGEYATPFNDRLPSGAGGRAASSGGGGFTSDSEKEAFIRAEAAKRGIDPNVAVWVSKREGFSNPVGDNGTSFGPFQLHVTPGGRGGAVGDQFRTRTGLDPSDPKNAQATVLFALDDIKRNGWSAYHGAANSGVAPWQGIDRGGAGGNSTSSTINVNGPITVTPPAGADPDQFASSFAAALKRQALAAQANRGQN